MSKIVRITPTERVFSISWIPHIRCNYDCMYCPDDRHDNTTRFPDLDRMKDHWQQILQKTGHLDLPYKINWSGGEPSLWKNFSPLIQWLRQEYSERIKQMGTISNGSASTKYYLKLFANLDYLTFSTHTEFMDEEKFFANARACQRYAVESNKSFMINIMEEYWNPDYNNRLIDLCRENQINFHITRITYNLPGTRTYPILQNNKQKRALTDLMINDRLIASTHEIVKNHLQLTDVKIEPDVNYNARIEHENGETVNIFSAKLYLLGLHRFEGWHCHAGSHRIFILPNTSVWSAECQNDALGRLDDGSFQIKTDPVTCRQEHCTNNPDDVMVEKYEV